MAAVYLAINLAIFYILVPILHSPWGLTRRQHRFALLLWMAALFILPINISLWVYQ